MQADIFFRPARINDAGFLTEVIIEAEKSGSSILSFSTLFDVNEDVAKDSILQMLEEEIDGCELSISSFIIATHNEQPIGGFGGWIEAGSGKPSKLVKANLIGFVFGHEKINLLKDRANIIRNMFFEREAGTLQLEYLFIEEAYRGMQIGDALIDKLIVKGKTEKPDLQKIQVQLYANNTAARKVYERNGFVITDEYTSKAAAVEAYLPGRVKLLMEKFL
jgi:ribosomal protein S18 acetylase RimI-like enzyme